MRENENRTLLHRIYVALWEKGYNPTVQIVGYILTKDPTYITNHDGARQMIRKIDRDELLHDIVAFYFFRDQKGETTEKDKHPI